MLFNSTGVPEKLGWAFGLGLERIAMVLFSIPDIRLFWSTDPRFLSQFSANSTSSILAGGGVLKKFKEYSKFPPCYKDFSFWVPEIVEGQGEGWHENDFCERVRDVAGDLVERVELVSIDLLLAFDRFYRERHGLMWVVIFHPLSD